MPSRTASELRPNRPNEKRRIGKKIARSNDVPMAATNARNGAAFSTCPQARRQDLAPSGREERKYRSRFRQSAGDLQPFDEASYPANTHAGVEESYLLDGELWIDARKLLPGDYNYSILRVKRNVRLLTARLIDVLNGGRGLFQDRP
jgi:hypothetical protein